MYVRSATRSKCPLKWKTTSLAGTAAAAEVRAAVDRASEMGTYGNSTTYLHDLRSCKIKQVNRTFVLRLHRFYAYQIGTLRPPLIVTD